MIVSSDSCEAEAPIPWQTCRAENWVRVQAKRAFEIVLGKMLQPTATTTEHIEVPYIRSLNVQWDDVTFVDLPTMWASRSEIEQLSLSVGDLLVCEGGEAGRASLIAEQPPQDCIIQNALHRVRANDLGHVGFLRYCLWLASETGWLDVICNRATIAHFTVEKFRDFWLWLPPVEHQKAIAAYLDAETAEIDALISEKRRMLALMEEKRAALVSRAVTRGLDPHVPLKPSGLDWIGEIPAHWRVVRLKHFARIGNGSTPNRDDSTYWQGGHYPWLNSSVVNSRSVREASRLVTDQALAECHLPRIAPPALLIAITGQGKTRGKTAVLAFEATINQHLAFVQPHPGIADCMYLSLLLDSAYDFLRSESDGAGSTRGAITTEQLGNFAVCLPPLLEQAAILHSLEIETWRFSDTEECLQRSITLLNERRSALITAAVTGQVPAELMRGRGPVAVAGAASA